MPDNKATMIRIYEEIISGRNLDAADELLADDFVEYEELPPGMPSGREAPKAMGAMTLSAFPDFRVTVEELLEDGDKVIARVRFSGTHRGDFMGIPGTGNSFDVPVIDIIEFRDGKAVAHWGVMDMAKMMQQLGVGAPPA